MSVPMALQISGEALSTMSATSVEGKAAGLGASATMALPEQEFSKALLAAQSSAGPVAATAVVPSMFAPKTPPEVPPEKSQELSDAVIVAEPVAEPPVGPQVSAVPGKFATLNTSALISSNPRVSTASVASQPDVKGESEPKVTAAGKEKRSTGEKDASGWQTAALQPGLAPLNPIQVSENQPPPIATASVVPVPPATSAITHGPGHSEGQADLPGKSSSLSNAGVPASPRDSSLGTEDRQSGFPAMPLEAVAEPKPVEKTGASETGTPMFPTDFAPTDSMRAKAETVGVVHSGAVNGTPATAPESAIPAAREGAQAAGQATATPEPGAKELTANLSSPVASHDGMAAVLPLSGSSGHSLAPVQSPVHDTATTPAQPGSLGLTGSPLPTAAHANRQSILDGAGTPSSPAREAVWQLSPNRVEAGFANGQNSWISVVAQRQDGHLTAALQSASVTERGTLEALLPQLSAHLAQRDFAVNQLGVSEGQQFEAGPNGQNESPTQNQGQGQMAQGSKSAPVLVPVADQNETTAVAAVNGSRISLRA
jgi:hypothetical protein